MREIKFRCFDKKENVMLIVHEMHWGDSSIELFHLQGYLKVDNGLRTISVSNPNEQFGDENRYEIMQYTGLKDKNDNEIYEGDIVKDDTNKIKTILFEGGSFGCRVKKLKSFYSQETIEVFYSLYEYVLGDVEIEVIGNLFENPSLLEGESND